MEPERIDLVEETRQPLAPTIRDIVAIVFRHQRLWVISFVFIFLSVVLWGALRPTYRAELKILVRRERVDPVVTSQSIVPTQIVQPEITESELNSEVELMRSQELLRKVVIANDLQAKPSRRPIPFSAASEEVHIAQAIRGLGNSLQVEPLHKTNMISVGYESSDPDLAARVLNSLAAFYLDKHQKVHRPSGEFAFFNKETKLLREDLGAAENQLMDFTRDQGVVSPQLERDLSLQKASELEGSLAQTRAAIAETEQRIRTLEQQQASVPPRTTTQLRTSDNPALLQQMKSTLLSLELKRTELLSKFEPTYRPVQELDKQISDTRTAISAEKDAPVHDETTDQNPVYEWVKTELAKDQTELNGLKARAAAEETALGKYRQVAQALQQATIVQQDLLRTVKEEEENYLLLSHKAEEASINDALDRGGILNIAIAEPATVPVLPRHSFLYYAFLGLVLAGFASTGSTFVADFLDPSFRTPDEVSRFMASPVLASIPRNSR